MKKIIALLIACSGLAHAEGTLIARVADEDVTVDTLSPFFSSLDESQREALKDNPTLMNQAVRRLIARRLLMKEALAAGWDKRPEVVSQMEQAREGVVLNSYLAEVTQPPASYPSDDQIAEVYESQKEELLLPKQVELAQIFIPKGEQSDKVQAAAADAMSAQLKKKVVSEDFAELARQYSAEKQSAVNGGSVGWLTLDNLRPEIRTAVASQGKGKVVGPLNLEDGIYFVKVLDVRPERTATLEEVKDRIVAVLRNQRAQQNQAAYLERLQQKHPVSINELSLTQLLEEKQ